jgi:hypothetical protein
MGKTTENIPENFDCNYKIKQKRQLPSGAPDFSSKIFIEFESNVQFLLSCGPGHKTTTNGPKLKVKIN